MIVRAVLWFCATESDAETIAGDLHEESVALRRTRWWLVRQTIRSAIPLLMMRWRSGELPSASLAAILAVTVPLRIADAFWAFIHSLVPLKADISWPAPIWIANLVLVCGCASITARGLGRETGRAFALISIATAALAISTGIGRAPLWYFAAVLILIPAAALLAGESRRFGGQP